MKGRAVALVALVLIFHGCAAPTTGRAPAASDAEHDKAAAHTDPPAWAKAVGVVVLPVVVVGVVMTCPVWCPIVLVNRALDRTESRQKANQKGCGKRDLLGFPVCAPSVPEKPTAPESPPVTSDPDSVDPRGPKGK